MRYMLLLHGADVDVHTHTPAWVEHAVGFLARFEDDLASRSELEWTEVLGDPRHADRVGPSGAVRTGDDLVAGDAAAGSALSRLWVVRVTDHARAIALATALVNELGTTIEVRECMPTAQRP